MNLIESFFVHWKTSLFGIAAAGFNQLQNGTNWKTVLVSAAIALLGLFSSDGNITATKAT